MYICIYIYICILYIVVNTYNIRSGLMYFSNSWISLCVLDMSPRINIPSLGTLIFALAMAFAARKHWTVPQMPLNLFGSKITGSLP